MFLRAPASEPADQRVDSLRFIMTLLAIFLPVAMIWVAALAVRSSRIVREESRRLQAAIDAMRQTYVADRQAGVTTLQPTVERKLNEIAKATQKTESALATFASSRDKVTVSLETNSQRHSGRGYRADQPCVGGPVAEDISAPITTTGFDPSAEFPPIRADDEVGFAALRLALKDRNASQLIQASQDILTLLSQDGIYMDDLRPDRARAEIWRRFARGERGRVVAALGRAFATARASL